MSNKNQNTNTDSKRLASLKASIENGEIDAISVDTTVFDDHGMRLDKGLFSQLTQFARHPSDLILSEVVLEEIKGHLAKHLETARTRFNRDMLDACEFVGGDFAEVLALKEKLSQMPMASVLCEKQIHEFIANSDAKIIAADQYMKIGEVLNRYFENQPPFHHDNQKKNEFPDAIALMSLEAWAKKQDRKMVVVSRDQDWKSFCDQSQFLYLVQDFPTALQLFQKSDGLVQARLSKIKKSLKSGKSEIIGLLKEAAKNHAWDWGQVAVHSPFEFDKNSISLAAIDSMVLVEDDEVTLVEVDDESISIVCEFQVEGQFALDFIFKEWDDLHEGYFFVGETSGTYPGLFEVSALFNLPLKEKNLEGSTFSISFGDAFVDVGEIYP